jgi:hypothetical protein
MDWLRGAVWRTGHAARIGRLAVPSALRLAEDALKEAVNDFS